MMKLRKSFWYRARSAVTGRFITIAQAMADKARSIVEKIRNKFS